MRESLVAAQVKQRNLNASIEQLPVEHSKQRLHFTAGQQKEASERANDLIWRQESLQEVCLVAV